MAVELLVALLLLFPKGGDQWSAWLYVGIRLFCLANVLSSPFPLFPFLVCSHLTCTFLEDVRSLRHEISNCFACRVESWAQRTLPAAFYLCCSSVKWRSPKPLWIHFRTIPCHHCRKMVPLSKWELAITCRKRGCMEMRETLPCGLAPKSAAFLTFRSQQRWKAPGQPLYSLGKKIQRLDKYFALINSICLIKQSLPTTKAGKIFYITLSATSKRLLWAWFEQLFPQPRMWRNAKLHPGWDPACCVCVLSCRLVGFIAVEVAGWPPSGERSPVGKRWAMEKEMMV